MLYIYVIININIKHICILDTGYWIWLFAYSSGQSLSNSPYGQLHSKYLKLLTSLIVAWARAHVHPLARLLTHHGEITHPPSRVLVRRYTTPLALSLYIYR